MFVDQTQQTKESEPVREIELEDLDGISGSGGKSDPKKWLPLVNPLIHGPRGGGGSAEPSVPEAWVDHLETYL
jgi:hypothetical protein